MLLAICEKKLAIFASIGNYFRPWYRLTWVVVKRLCVCVCVCVCVCFSDSFDAHDRHRLLACSRSEDAVMQLRRLVCLSVCPSVGEAASVADDEYLPFDLPTIRFAAQRRERRLFQASFWFFLGGGEFPPPKKTKIPPNGCQVVCSKSFFSRCNELVIYHGGILLMG